MWECVVCAEQIEDDFDVCWNCQTLKDGSPSKSYASAALPKELERLRERMSHDSDENLSQIVNVNFRDYSKEALILARGELARRNLPMRPMAKLCSTCKAELEDDAKFCVECQTPVAKVVVAKDTVLECPNCQKTISAVSKFCKYCAAEIMLSPPSAKLCPNCESELEDDAKFCAECRTPIAKDGAFECPNCQKTLNVGSKFCKYCSAEITPPAKVPPVFARSSYASVSTPSSQNTKANNLTKSGAALAIVSGIAFWWGRSYTSDWENRAGAILGSLVGQQDSTYQFAQMCVVLGLLGMIAGVILFIVGWLQK